MHLSSTRSVAIRTASVRDIRLRYVFASGAFSLYLLVFLGLLLGWDYTSSNRLGLSFNVPFGIACGAFLTLIRVLREFADS